MRRTLKVLVLVGCFHVFIQARAQVEYVDPSIGGVGFLLEPTRPVVHLPNGMVRVYPVRKDALDDRIRSFPLSIISHRLGELFWMMPVGGVPDSGAWGRAAAYDQEKITPYYYSTRLDDLLIRIEFTPAERCGYFRFTFPSGKAVVLLANRFSGALARQDDNTVTGFERFNNMQVFIYGEFNVPVTSTVENEGDKSRLAIFARQDQKKMEFRYGISFISVEQAKKNLQKELPKWGFDKAKAAAMDRWNDVLGRVAVAGGTEAQRRVFYTALYRCYERMINITEDGRYYSAFDRKLHADQRPFYVDNGIWDTFRALEPLHTLLNPRMEADKIQSYVRIYEQSGWMPSFAMIWGDYACMSGNHAAGWISDAWFKGIRNFNIKKAYEGLRKNALEATLLPWRNGPKTKLDDFYNERGYFPSLPPGVPETEPLVHPFENRQSVAVTLGASYDDWCIAQLARVTGNAADYELFMKRSGNYANVFRKEKCMMWPRDAEGKWIEPFDPKFDGGMGGRAYFGENNAYTYNWDVLHDLAGLFELMGGCGRAEAILDQLFREDIGRSKYEFWSRFPDSTGLVGLFSMGNEPGFSIPYIYNRLGSPWKTQKRIRMLLESFFNDTLFGMPGNEDGGGMSAFVVFSMMGFYPVTPGLPVYDVGSPVFDSVTIRLQNDKKLKIIARSTSKDNKYVQRIQMNGKPLNQAWFRHSDIVNGGTLDMYMGSIPNKMLGADPAVFPPCSRSVDPQNLSLPEK